MGKKSRKNQNRAVAAAAVGERTATPTTTTTTTTANDVLPSLQEEPKQQERPAATGGYYADYVDNLNAVLHHIAPNIPHTAPISAVVNAAKTIKSVPRFIMSWLAECIEVHRRLLHLGYVDHQRSHHCAALSHILLTLSKATVEKTLGHSRTDRRRRPNSPTSTVAMGGGGEQEDTTAIEQLVEILRHETDSVYNGDDEDDGGDCTCTIQDLLFGNDTFRVGTFFASIQDYTDGVLFRWQALKEQCEHFRRTDRPRPVLGVAAASLWTDFFCRQIKMLEQDIANTYPYLTSTASKISVVIFDEQIQSLANYGVDRIDAIGYVASIVQTVLDEPELPQSQYCNFSNFNFTAPTKLMRELKKRGLTRAESKEIFQYVAFRTTNLAVEATYSEFVRPTMKVMYTHFLVHKSMNGCRLKPESPWDERENQASTMTDDTASSFLINELVPALLETYGDDDNNNSSLLCPTPCLESLQQDEEPSLALSFTVHCMLSSVVALQGDDDVKSMATAARIAFLKRKAAFSQHCALIERLPNVLLNPYFAGLWCSTLLHHVHIRRATEYETVLFAVRLYNYLRDKKQAVAVIPLLDTLSRYEFASPVEAFFSDCGLMPRRDTMLHVIEKCDLFVMRKPYVTLDLDAVANLCGDFAGILQNFFTQTKDELVDQWFQQRLEWADDVANQVGLCMADHFGDDRRVRLFS